MNSIKFGAILTIALSMAFLGFSTLPGVNASSGCWNVTASKWATNIFGLKLYQYDIGNQFCTNGSSITSVCCLYGNQYAWLGWSSRGHSESYYEGGVGQSYIGIHGNAHFALQTLWWTNDQYVDIYVWEHGDGSVTSA